MARNKYDIDEKLEAEFNVHYLKRLGKYLLGYKKELIKGLTLMVLTSVFSLVTPYLISIAIDEMIPDENLAGLIMISVAFLAAIGISNFALHKRIIITSRMGNSIVRDIRKDLFEHIQKLSFDYFDSRPHGKILVRVVNYVNSLSDLLSMGLINLLNDFLSLLIIMGFMFALNAKLAIIVILGLPPLIAFVVIIKKIQRKAWQMFSNKNSNLNAYIHESISGIKEIQAFVRQKFNENIFDKLSHEYKNYWMKAVKANLLVPIIIGLISIMTIIAVLLGGIVWFKPVIRVGVLVAFIGYIDRFWQPILNMGNLYNQIITAMAYLERIFETMDEEPDIKDEHEAYELTNIKGQVDFKNVSFSYIKGHYILKNINQKFKPGTKVAIVGPTGAGKTTIVSLLSRFYDIDEGSIEIDGNDIKDVKIESLRKKMGVMLQDPFIFSGTIEDNIRYGRLDATEEEIVEAAKAVKAHEFIMEMENDYKTETNERGSRLSVGQRQLISFARTILSDPKVLVLDEATSSIDTKTEKLVQQGLERLLEGRTSFIIAHRLSTIINSDVILYIENKGIAEMGSHDELIKKKGKYYKLYMQQYKYLNYT